MLNCFWYMVLSTFEHQKEPTQDTSRTLAKTPCCNLSCLERAKPIGTKGLVLRVNQCLLKFNILVMGTKLPYKFGQLCCHVGLLRWSGQIVSVGHQACLEETDRV